MSKIKKYFKGFVSLFFRGLLFIVPLSLIIWGIVNLIQWLEGIISTQISIKDVIIPGFVIAIVIILLIALLGWIGTTIVAVPVRNYFNRLLERAPLLKTVLYGH